MTNDRRKAEDYPGKIPDPLERNVRMLMTDMYYTGGSVRERLTRIEERLDHIPTKTYILTSIISVSVVLLGGFITILVRLYASSPLP